MSTRNLFKNQSRSRLYGSKLMSEEMFYLYAGIAMGIVFAVVAMAITFLCVFRSHIFW
jgi:tetrahydromethanopterin S-methyltransferase subunit F